MWALIVGSRLPQNEITLNTEHFSEFAFHFKEKEEKHFSNEDVY